MPTAESKLIDAVRSLKQSTQITLKRIYGWFLVHGHTASGADKPFLTEDDGTVKNSVYGTDGTNLKNFLLATDGEQINIISGRDSAGNVDPLLTNDERALVVEIETTAKSVVEGVAIPISEADVWNPGGLSTDFFDIDLEVVCIDTVTDATGVSVGIDYSDSSGASDRYFLKGITVPTQAVGVRVGPYRIKQNDAIRAECTSGASDAQLHVHILREGTI